MYAIRSYYELWIGTLDGGINKVDLGRQQIHSYKLPHDNLRPIPIDAVSCITTSPDNEDEIWIGTIGNGLYNFNRKNNEFEVFRYNKNNPRSMPSNNIRITSYNVCYTKLLRIWKHSIHSGKNT